MRLSVRRMSRRQRASSEPRRARPGPDLVATPRQRPGPVREWIARARGAETAPPIAVPQLSREWIARARGLAEAENRGRRTPHWGASSHTMKTSSK
ncbi:MAG: hypothetical protein V1750_04860 [Acidobacteriota bacterium]